MPLTVYRLCCNHKRVKTHPTILWVLLSASVLLSRASVSAADNDNFANADLRQGTNITYVSSLTGATFESGEPAAAGTNTVWMKWAASDSGPVQLRMEGFWPATSYAVYTGSSVDQLQSVNLTYVPANGTDRFIALKDTVYYFQFSGVGTVFTFHLNFYPFGNSVNDDFENALVINSPASFGPASVADATMELGEPAHMGAVPQKSIWWRIQPTVSTTGYIDGTGGLASNVVFALYSGDSVETLQLISKTTTKYFNIHLGAGQSYYLAAAVPTNAWGDVAGFVGHFSGGWSEPLPGNLLQEPSWEGTGLLNAEYWHWSAAIGGYVNENGGVDGKTWPAVPASTTIWQDFPTMPGHTYTIRFATFIGGSLSAGSGNAATEVLWDTNQLAVATIPEAGAGSWHWNIFSAVASNTTTRISFRPLTRAVEMDAFSVVDASAPPEIVTQPASVSTLVGGTASFLVGARGSTPLHYQWCFNQTPLGGENDKRLVLDSVGTNQAGNYSVIVTNGFGAVTSQVASLVVDAPQVATILAQPFGDTVTVGGYFQASVVASGTPPLSYQWFHNDTLVGGATNRSLVLTNIQPADSGEYTVRVQDTASTVWSLPAQLTVSTAVEGGGTIDFRNDFPGWTNLWAPVFDLDGVTPLSGSQYVAQLYAGPTLAQLRPAAPPTPFRAGFNAGFFQPQLITLASVPVGSNAVVQVMAWDTAFGDSYEQARFTGGKVGKSQILNVTTGGDGAPDGSLLGMSSFSLQAGLPFFQLATIQFLERQPGNLVIWELFGQPGSLYVIEKSDQINEVVWRPYTVVTNVTGTVTFSDQANSGSAVVLYRARILN